MRWRVALMLVAVNAAAAAFVSLVAFFDDAVALLAALSAWVTAHPRDISIFFSILFALIALALINFWAYVNGCRWEQRAARR